MSMTPASETFQAVEHCMLGLFSAKSFLRVDSHRYCWVSHAVAEHLLISLFVSVTKRYMCRCYCFAATVIVAAAAAPAATAAAHGAVTMASAVIVSFDCP